jgi:hypothetical protein
MVRGKQFAECHVNDAYECNDVGFQKFKWKLKFAVELFAFVFSFREAQD